MVNFQIHIIMKKLITLVLLATLLFIAGCEKKESKAIKQEATVIYEGPLALDGCGYFLLINDIKYKPIELKEAFSVDGLVVNVDYQLLDTKWQCNWQEKKYDQIKIIHISKK